MRCRKVLPFLILVTTFYSLSAQVQLTVPTNIQTCYKKGIRSPDGQPGKSYWQNAADYELTINFDPVSRFLKGSEDIKYTNNSPDTLRSVLFKLYPNLYKKGAVRSMPVKPEDLTDGVWIQSMTMNGEAIDSSHIRIDGTNMIVPGHRVFPKQTVSFHINWSYTMNKTSEIRTGEINPRTDFVAYFFPRIAVYDDIDGWNTFPYNGMQEFYNDFCNFKASITVPSTQVVWATGILLNGQHVLSEKTYQKLQQAEKNDGTTTVIDSTGLQNATRQDQATNTWQFEASDVTDFVFGCSDHYMWQSTSLVVDSATGRRTRVDAVYEPKDSDYFGVIYDARKTVESMSFRFPKWPFPYPHETVFDGLDQMEYPMMVNDNPLHDHAESVELTDHEIFHTMFPFYMGINETKYAWMDEGWATIGEWLISPMIDPALVDEYGVLAVERTAGTETDVPIVTLSTELYRGYFTNSYPKPAMGYLFIKDMLGEELFDKAIHHYIKTWQGKHPMPLDFFNCMNAGSGKNLNWFWKKWFFDSGIPDLAISLVTQNGSQKQILVSSIGSKPVPIDLLVTYSDGTTDKIHKTIAVWETGKSSYTVTFSSAKKIKNIRLGDTHTPDANHLDNIWAGGK